MSRASTVEGEKYGSCLSKRNLHFLAGLCWSMGCLPVYFLSNRVAHDAMLLPVIAKASIQPLIPDFK